MTTEKPKEQDCGAQQPHKAHPWYDRSGKKLDCPGRAAPAGWVDPKLRRRGD